MQIPVDMNDDEQDLVVIHSNGLPTFLVVYELIEHGGGKWVIEDLLGGIETNLMLASVGPVLIDIPVEPHRFRLPIDNDPS